MGVVSVRIPAGLQEELEASSIRIPDAVRAYLVELATALRVHRKMDLLEAYGTTARRAAAETVRLAREEH